MEAFIHVMLKLSLTFLAYAGCIHLFLKIVGVEENPGMFIKLLGFTCIFAWMLASFCSLATMVFGIWFYL